MNISKFSLKPGVVLRISIKRLDREGRSTWTTTAAAMRMVGKAGGGSGVVSEDVSSPGGGHGLQVEGMMGKGLWVGSCAEVPAGT
ncbi:hypothetical protein OUZ56_033460 [Daphnia magna]|uniref:Uncharacterized protein n=1 Tax=Daphnia magna TaxID=35525 RepID=A0ABQ9ZXW2_9CRUS|nr:hypothetical protein OUZ56_033460 [Daphnia magna]